MGLCGSKVTEGGTLRFVGGRGHLFEAVQDIAVEVGFVVLAVHALALLTAQYSRLEALAVLLDAEGLAAGAALVLPALQLYALRQGWSSRGPHPLAALLVVAVDAAALLVALPARRKALAVQLHALGIATVAEELFGGAFPIKRVHYQWMI